MSIELPTIAVMCGSASDAIRYEPEMAALGRSIAEFPARLVWGGGNIGSMGVVSRAFKQHSTVKPLGFLPGFLQKKERPAQDDSAELYYVDNLATRMDNFWKSDAIVIAPGGLGTIQELGDVVAQKYCQLCAPHILLLNLEGFFSGYSIQISRCMSDQFINDGHEPFLPDVTKSIDGARTYFAEKLQPQL